MASTPLNLSGMFENSPSAAPRSRERVENIPVDLIDSHPRNTTYVTETMLDPAFRESVAAFGVLQPVLVIPNDNAAGRYYLLAGHKRLLGSRLCGRSYIPAIIRKGLPPGLEGIYITDTNLQYGVQNMLPSEKCRTLWEQHQSLKEFGNTVGHMLKKNRSLNWAVKCSNLDTLKKRERHWQLRMG